MFPVELKWNYYGPGKTGSNFFCYDAIRFPLKGFSFSHRNVKPHKRGVLYLTTFKGFVFFLCVKRFRPIIKVENNSQEKFTILHVPHIGFLCYLLDGRDEILL